MKMVNTSLQFRPKGSFHNENAVTVMHAILLCLDVDDFQLQGEK